MLLVWCSHFLAPPLSSSERVVGLFGDVKGKEMETAKDGDRMDES